MSKHSRRGFLAVSAATLTGLAGCTALGNNGDDSGNTNNQQQNDRECTGAYITNFNWDGSLFGEDAFEAELVNQGDIAGTVTIKLTFYESEDAVNEQGRVTESFSIGAQATKDITIEANAPTDNSNYATMSVASQDCQY